MSLRNIETLETFHFDSLADLRDWLNQFIRTNIDRVHPQESDYITLHWNEETLSDGSTVNNVSITTQ
jgi:hypothetical protein